MVKFLFLPAILILLPGSQVFASSHSTHTFVSSGPYNGVGAELSMVFPDAPGMGMGLGGHMLFGFDLGRAGVLALYPNLDFWFASHHNYYYGPNFPNGYDFSVWEFCLFLDTRYYFPVPASSPVKPYAGLGLGPIFTNLHYSPDYSPYLDDSYASVGMNFLAGIDFPLGSSGMIGFVEIKGTVASDYPESVAKMTFGITFPF